LSLRKWSKAIVSELVTDASGKAALSSDFTPVGDPQSHRGEQPDFAGVGWRWGGIIFGLATQALFFWTVINLFQFLRYGGSGARPFSPAWDVLLALGFAWPHSVLLIPGVQKILRKHIPAGWLGCVHCSTTCISLLLLFALWRPSPITVWNLHGLPSHMMLVGFYASWLGLLYSLYLTGLGYQTGLTQWWYWLKRSKPPRREFVVRGVYRWMRHPVYLSFMGLIWFTPRMSLDHVVLTAIWTIYIFVGSVKKDSRLEHYIGTPYREYAQRVAGYPLIGFGRLGKWPRTRTDATVSRPTLT
jgi:protein-S-isoprenylcysteine O-methyltransferase Ste14